MNGLTAEFYDRHPDAGEVVRDIEPGKDVQLDGYFTAEMLRTLIELIGRPAEKE